MFLILNDAFPFDINHFNASGHTDIFEMHIVNTRMRWQGADQSNGRPESY